MTGKNSFSLITAKYRLVLRDKNGKVLMKLERESRSFTKNFAEIIRGLFYSRTSNTTANVVDTNGTSQTPYVACLVSCPPAIPERRYGGTRPLGVNAPEGNVSYGIVVGKGTTPPSPTDYKLEALYPHGTDVDQLYYGACSISSVVADATKSSVIVTRTFTNSYTAPQTVTEIGMIASIQYANYETSIHTLYALIIRDVLDTPVEIPAGLSLTVSYVFDFPI